MYTRRARAAKAERREHALVVNARAVEEEFCLEERAREREREAKHFEANFHKYCPPPHNIVKSRLSKKKKKKKKKTKKKDKNDDDDITERVAND